MSGVLMRPAALTRGASDEADVIAVDLSPDRPAGVEQRAQA